MSTQFNIGKVDKMVIISTSSNTPAKSKESDEIQKLMKLALGKGIPEEKSESIPSVAEDGEKKKCKRVLMRCNNIYMAVE